MSSSILCYLIDDDADDREIFQIAVSEFDDSIRCCFAKDGIDALEKLNADEGFLPDYIFLDLNMPRMNGIQCLAEIKKMERLNHVPVFMYSTSSDSKFISESIRSGAADYIIKPSSIKDLTMLLSKILKKITD